MKKYNNFDELVKDYPKKEDREKILKQMSNEEINVLIKNMKNNQGKGYLGRFKK